MPISPLILQLASEVIETFKKKRKKIVTAESCTGGLIAAALTSVPGSSAVFERGLVSYSQESKTDLLGVLPEMIAHHGIVSNEIAEEMAQGALDFSMADVAVSVTGIAGPTGETPDTPVGFVCFGVATHEGSRYHMNYRFHGDRDMIREQAVLEALKLLLATQDDYND